MADVEKKWRDKGVVFVGIDSIDENAKAKLYEEQYGIEYESVVDPAGDTAAAWRVTGYPETFFIGPDGHIVSKFISSIDEATLEENLAQIAG